jgi:hypothetical protein
MTNLDFPTNPSDGDTFNNYIYSATKGAWRIQPNVPAVTSRFYVSDTAPAEPVNGEIWLNSADGNTYIYYVGENGGQWIEIGGQTGTPNLEDLGNVSITSPVDGQALVYNGNEWVPGSVESGLHPFFGR